jgi:hypothetical protein
MNLYFAVRSTPAKTVEALDFAAENPTLYSRKVIKKLNTLGCASYSIRCEGASWKVVGENLGISEDTAQKNARHFARTSFLPWPVPLNE